jgi:hypothetical protein
MTLPAPRAMAPLGAMTEQPAYGGAYVTPPAENETIFDPFGWGSRYDVDALVQAKKCAEDAAAATAPPPETSVVKATRGEIYFRAEAFVLQRSHSFGQPIALDFLTGNVVLDSRDLSFRQEVGQRLITGYEINETSAIEGTFFQNQNWSSSNSATGANSLFLAGNPPTTPSDLSLATFDFNGAANMTITNSTAIQNWELNWLQHSAFKRMTFIGGFRYLALKDFYDINSTNALLGSTSDYTVRTYNHLYGGQFGLLLKQDIDLFTFEFTAKTGLYNNFQAQNSVVLDEGNTISRRNASTAASNIAFVNDLDLTGTYHFSNFLILRLGVDVIWIDKVGLAPEYLDFSISPTAGAQSIHGGDLVLWGFHGGLELRF